MPSPYRRWRRHTDAKFETGLAVGVRQDGEGVASYSIALSPVEILANGVDVPRRLVNVIEERFASSRVLLPVIHVESEDQALRNAAIAREALCDGVFLINHAVSSGKLLAIHAAVVRELPDWWVGVNCLDLHPQQVFHEVDSGVDGVWVDNAMVDERHEAQADAEAIRDSRTRSGWEGLYFGGVAFKYQRPVPDLQKAARLAAEYMDVVTTSGPGTGQAASRQKILDMKQSLGDLPLAIASGITPGNIGDYLPAADCFLVASGISKSFTDLDCRLVRELSERIHEYGRRAAASESAELHGEKRIRSVCFICGWNEGRSAHLELSVRHKLRAAARGVRVSSAGLHQGGTVNALRREYLRGIGIPCEEIDAHRSAVFDPRHGDADLVLVVERPMRDELLAQYPELRDRVMTVRGFLQGYRPENDPLSVVEAHIEDAGGHDETEKLVLYAELEDLAAEVASRLIGLSNARGL